MSHVQIVSAALIIVSGALLYARNSFRRRLEDQALNFSAQRADFEREVFALRIKNEEFSGILRSMAELVIAVDPEGRILYLNPSAEKIFQVNSGASIGKSFLEVIRQSTVSALISLALKAGAEVSESIHLFLPDEKFFDAKAIPLVADMKTRGVLLVLHDVTAVKKLEEVRKDFVANVSHELRTPLTSIQGYAETLLDGALSDDKNNREFVQTIHDQAERLSRLVNDLLDLSAIESGRKTPKSADFILKDLIAEVKNSLSPLAKKRGVKIDADIPENLVFRADRDQIKQVLINLVDNAVKFNRKGGTVFLSASSNESGTTLQVKDSGNGIPESDLPRIFERFYRVDKGRSREEGGTGLGLAIVKHIVEAHGGTVRVESLSGEGSTFFVHLPK